MSQLIPPNLMIIVPAWNEEGAVGQVVESIRAVLPSVPVFVIDDRSDDATVNVAARAGASVLSLPVHLGLGGCVQTGYMLAFELGVEYVIRLDGDGQHNATEIPNILAALIQTGADVANRAGLRDRSTHLANDDAAAVAPDHGWADHHGANSARAPGRAH